MKLLGSLTSPFVRKVRIVLAEKKIDCDLIIDSPWVDTTMVPSHNPLGKIPVLILDDGTEIYDSRVIVEYLDSTTPNNRLIPESGRERMMVKRWEALADGVCDAAATVFLERKRPAELQSQEWITRQLKKMDRGVDAMANQLATRPWCHGTAYSLADIATGTALGYLAFRFADMDWPTRHPELGQLYQQLMARKPFIDTIPQG